MERRGWVRPRAEGSYLHAIERQWLIALGVNQKLLPASVVNQTVKERAEALAKQQDHPPGRKQLRELRERTLAELMPKALTRRRTTHAWIDQAHGWLVVDSASEKKAEELLEALRKAQPDVAAKRLDTERSPAAAMTAWLSAGDAPDGFTIDQDLELRASGENPGTVRYVRHPLEGREIRDHIAGGKTATRLGLTWNDRISFMLTEQLQVKRLAFLNVIKEENLTQADDAEEQFDIEFALMSGELAQLLADLTRALDGEKKPGT
jgi:recombination associated protein RdgC